VKKTPKRTPNQQPLEETALDLKEIRQIVELMNKHELSYFHVEKDGFRLKLKKGADLDAMQDMLRAAGPPAQLTTGPVALPPVQPMSPPAGGDAAAEPEGDHIKAPMVGTFYSSPDPESPPFVSVGSEVDENTTVCMIEAMKTFNEIKAECRGTIVKVLVDNAQAVQYDDPLFVIKPA
tara:strand:+ start:2626 stop:3159 length:534 start_codon:yes stop_codon:yes gene_type:complete